MKKILFKTIFLLVALNGLNAQNEFRSDWANYINYGIDMPNSNISSGLNVEEYTGALTYSFGVHQMSVGGRSFPVSINYYSSGVKVDDYSSCVGMGWNLSAGGSITKITCGLDDDFINSNGVGIGYNYPVPNGKSRSAYWSYTGQLDTEKDYYVFNAFGFSGTFYYSKPDEKYLPLSGEKVTITKEFIDGILQFVITDDYGTKYCFGLTEVISQYFDNEQSPKAIVNGSYYLTKVILTNKEQITLVYEVKLIQRLLTSINEYNVSQYSCRDTGCSAGGVTTGDYFKKVGYTSTNGFRLKQIISPNQTLLFNYHTQPRLDMVNDYALTGIELVVNGSIVKRLMLEHDYLSDRLMLKRILDITGGLQLTLPLITIDYYSEYTMPSPFSLRSQDLFGYFNNEPVVNNPKSNEPSLIKFHEHYGSNCEADEDFAGPARNGVSSDILKTLLIKNVKTAQGEIQDINYERNSYLGGAYIHKGVTYPGDAPGLRVAQIVTSNSASPNLKHYKRYTYTSGGLSEGIRLYFETDKSISYKFSNGCDGVLRIAGTSRNSSPFNSSLIYYKSVRVRQYSNNELLLGTIINTYSTADVSYISLGNTYCEKSRWGKLVSSVEYNENNVLISSLNNYFVEDFIPNTHLCVRPFKTTDDGGYLSVNYSRNPGSLLLSYSVKQEFNTAGSPLRKTKTQYFYNLAKDVYRIDYSVNNILKQKVYLKRPYDFQTPATGYDEYTSAVQKMNERNISAPVIETIKTKIVGADEFVENSTVSLYKYDNINDIIIPAKELSFKKHVPILYSNFQGLSFVNGTPDYHAQFESRFTLSISNNKGYVNELVQNNNLYVSNLVTSYGATIANFSNARFNEIAFMGFEPYELENTSTTSIINENWTMGSTTTCLDDVVVSGGFSGNFSIDFSKCLGFTFLFNKVLDANKKYKLRYWKKSGSLNVSPSAGTVTSELVLYTANGWSLIERTIFGATYIAIGSTTAQVDDIMLYPEDAVLQYVNYDIRNRKTSECSNNGDCQFYEYDAIHRVTTIRDSKQNIIKKIEFGIQEQQ